MKKNLGYVSISVTYLFLIKLGVGGSEKVYVTVDSKIR